MKLFKIFLFTTFLILFLFVFLNILKYRNWYQGTFQETDIICLRDIEIEQEDIDEKIKNFVLSDSGTEFIVLDVNEVIHILESNIQGSEIVSLKDICIEDNRGVWTIFLRYEIRDTSMPWLVLNIVKDDRETPEIYVRELTIGNIDIPFGIGRNIIRNVNRGISEAIILLNENQFLGREIRNIELLEERVVIR